jgi:hypothetical protein
MRKVWLVEGLDHLMKIGRRWGRRRIRVRIDLREQGKTHPNLSQLPRRKKRRREINQNGAVFFQRSLKDNLRCPNLTLKNDCLR